MCKFTLFLLFSMHYTAGLSGVTKYGWRGFLICRNRSRLLGQLGNEPVTYCVYDTKSAPVNYCPPCPHNGPNTRNCDQLNDGKMLKGPK